MGLHLTVLTKFLIFKQTISRASKRLFSYTALYTMWARVWPRPSVSCVHCLTTSLESTIMNTKTTFTTIGNLIDAFRLHLPPLQGLDPNEPSSHHVLLSHALVEASTIKLYGMYFHLNSIAKDRCLAAAEKIITCGGLDLHAFGYMNPIIGVRTSIYDKYFLILISPIKTLWMIACRVFIEGISSTRQHRQQWRSAYREVTTWNPLPSTFLFSGYTNRICILNLSICAYTSTLLSLLV